MPCSEEELWQFLPAASPPPRLPCPSPSLPRPHHPSRCSPSSSHPSTGLPTRPAGVWNHFKGYFNCLCFPQHFLMEPVSSSYIKRKCASNLPLAQCKRKTSMIMCVKRIDFEDQSNSVALSSQRPGQSELRNPDVGPNFVADQIWIV